MMGVRRLFDGLGRSLVPILCRLPGKCLLMLLLDMLRRTLSRHFPQHVRNLLNSDDLAVRLVRSSHWQYKCKKYTNSDFNHLLLVLPW